jgi:ATP-dependent helicase HrpB
LRKLAQTPEAPAPSDTAETDLREVWLKAFADRLAAWIGESLVFALADGRKALLPLEKGKRPPNLVLALDIRERAGAGQARQVSIAIFLPCAPELVQKVFPEESTWREVSEFDERQNRVVREARLMFRELAIASRHATPARDDRRAAAEIWADKFASGELSHPGFDEKAGQLVARIAIARKLYPDLEFPQLDADDWRLIYGEACAGRNSLKDIEKVALEPHIGRYLGETLLDFLDRMLPVRKRLPSGRWGRFTYFESRTPELSARLGDFIGLSGTLSLCEGRLPVLFDIQAPNHRTVQKTPDLGSFWKNTYPAVKKELQRRYPRHPWP